MALGWAPGGAVPNMPPGVGLRMPTPGTRFQLEIHYYNTTGKVQPDSSGVKFCVTSKPTQYTATTAVLGSEFILLAAGTRADVTGKCTPGYLGGTDERDIHILYASPHMHKLGTHMKTVINRKDGGSDILVDKPFSFMDQRTYPTPAIVRPGDTLSTTCTFENTTSSYATYGSKTSQEMCYNFVVAYPADLLANPGLSAQGSENTCMQ